MAQLGFYHNNDECIGCKTCVMACKDKNDLPLGEKFRRVYDVGGGSWDIGDDGVITPNNVFAYSASVACMHCSEPMCLAVCPESAYTKREEDGVVLHNPEVCLGCGMCSTACPFTVPYVSRKTNTTRKCDFCLEYTSVGEAPACVSSCPMRCLEYGDIEELKAQHGTVQSVDPLPKDALTGPNIVFTRSRLNPDGAYAGVVLNSPEEITSETVEI